MQVHELIALGRFLSTYVQEEKLPQKYQELIQAVQQAAQNQNPEQVAKLVDELRGLHEKAQEQVMSPAQAKLLSEFGADQLLGRAATIRIDEAFTKHQANPQGVVSALENLKNETSQMSKRAGQLVSILEPMLDDVLGFEAEVKEGEGRLWLYFESAASVNTVDDLEKAASTWKGILHKFSRLPDARSTSARILNISKHSPLEIELASTLSLLVPLAYGIHWVLSRVEHVIKIGQEAERLKQLKMKTRIVEAVEAEAVEERKKISEQAADAVQERFGGDNESRNAIQQGLREVLRFVLDGGQLDIDTSREADESQEGGSNGDEKSVELKQLIVEIRRDIKYLPSPHESSSSDPESAES